MANILITGASGYLGGTVFEQLQQQQSASPLPAHGKIYALVRNDDQAAKVQSLYGAEPLTLQLDDQAGITHALLARRISVVLYLIDAFRADAQLRFIEALAEVQRQHGVTAHFVHTSGAKLFSSHADHPVDRPLADSDGRLHAIQTAARPELEPMQIALNTNNTIIAAAEARSVRSYIFIPCVVYGESTGFGNRISIQTVAIVRAAKALRRVYRVDQSRTSWPVSHVIDTAALYIQMLRGILTGEPLEYGKQGYYLASSGTVAWDDLYSALARALAKRGVIDDTEVLQADDKALQGMADALGCGKEFVGVQLAGR
ncbi:NAD(P)-binding protein [Polychaeton citri CBS 116435]|uniref:NAD(P)-binding protein n=1 Tax=Polychaeton citri CBS 116435 TaxID=1314669 RepID=A0A9P4Q3Y8_9PEZI|nr:NAD(P)-binding protein [Polychaeton citri CBS 116435]